MYRELRSTLLHSQVRRMAGFRLRTICMALTTLLIGSHVVVAKNGSATQPAAPNTAADRKDPFLGVYEAIPFDKVLSGNLRGKGDLDDIALTPAMDDQQKSVNLRWDAAKNCRIVGPVRMMAMDRVRFELLPTP